MVDHIYSSYLLYLSCSLYCLPFDDKQVVHCGFIGASLLNMAGSRVDESSKTEPKRKLGTIINQHEGWKEL